jgi:hypothetical protein
MHCPNCRHDNAASTRFCTSCGAVLVESTPDGRRRRVLRPWGLLRSAPLTVSPAMPEIVAAARADRGMRGSRRLDLRFAAGTAVVALAGTFLYPYARALDAPRIEHVVPAEPVVVTTTSSHAVQEAVVAAPALVEPLRPRSRTLVTVVPRESPRDAAPNARAAPAAPPLPAVVAEPPPVVAQAPVVVAQAAAPAPSRDRWQPLRDALSRCGARHGMFERATCEQGARLAHCDGAWGETALCPVARSDYGQ